MTSVLTFRKPRKQPTVVYKQGRTGHWGDMEACNLETLVKQHLAGEIGLAEVVRLTVIATGRTEKSVRCRINIMLPKPAHETHKAGPPAPRVAGPDPECSLTRMRAALYGRVKLEGPTGYVLDGRPVGFYDCMKEANRVLHGRGEKQIVGSPEWAI